MPEILVRLQRHFCPSVAYERATLHVSQCEMRHSNPILQEVAWQLLFGKTNVNFEESYKFMHSSNMSTNVEEKFIYLFIEI